MAQIEVTTVYMLGLFSWAVEIVSGRVQLHPRKYLFLNNDIFSYRQSLTLPTLCGSSAYSSMCSQLEHCVTMLRLPNPTALMAIELRFLRIWVQYKFFVLYFCDLNTCCKHSVYYAVPVTTFSLSCRLCPYFNGQHHLEEIMYYENVRRSQLLTLLDKFRDMLILCQHEDVGITTWLNDDKTPTLNRSW